MSTELTPQDRAERFFVALTRLAQEHDILAMWIEEVYAVAFFLRRGVVRGVNGNYDATALLNGVDIQLKGEILE